LAEFKPTKSQSDAINERDRGLLVSAAAGSGKTKVLTERLLSQLKDGLIGVNVDDFLIITFTKAAAGELKSRIMDEIAARLALDPDNRHLRKQSALCQRAQIGTIHSFCANLLRKNCHAAGLSPEFKVIEEERADAIKARVIDRVLESRYENMDSAFALLVDSVGRGRNDARLAELIISLHRKMQSHAVPEKWALARIEELSGDYADVSDTVWGEEIMSSLKSSADFWRRRMELLIGQLQEEEKIAAAYVPSIEETMRSLENFSDSMILGWDRAREMLPIEFPRLGTLRNSPDPELSDYAKAAREYCKSAAKGFSEIMSADSEKLLADMRKTAPAMQALLELTLEFDRVYAAEKSRRGEVDFSDLEHMAYKLLNENSDVAVSESRFREIMVDEYQDVNAVQDAIFSTISHGGNNLFMVGDVKQSIYRFRLADPTIFTRKYNDFFDLDKALKYQSARIMLQENFRSRREVINAVNHVFRTCMSEKLGDIAYDSNAELKCGADYYTGEVPAPELMLVGITKGEDEENPDKTAVEAAFVAEKIKSLVQSGTLVTDRDVRRPMRYSDIVILLRSANTVGDAFRRALIAADVPVMNGQGGSFYESVEISGIMSLLAVIDNPRQDVPLISVLRSPFFGFSADELSEIRAEDKNTDFYTALRKHGEHDAKCAEFLDLLGLFRDYAKDMELGELIWKLYGELDAFAICSAMRDGDNRVGNLTAMLDMAKRFESTGYRGLHRFVEWLIKLQERGEEPSRGSSGNAVQIMTVHKSKGLEFPVVFLCNTDRRFNKQDSMATVLVHPELGLGPKVTDTERGIEYSSLARNAIKLRSEREMLSEEMRLLYVALTRAKEYLFMTAAMKNPEDKLQKLMPLMTKPMSPEVLMTAGSPVTWLMYSVLSDNDECIKLSVHYPEKQEDTENAVESLEKCEANEEITERIRRNLAFVYPHKNAESLPSKVTATEMKRLEEPDTEAKSVAPKSRGGVFRSPDFLRDSRPMTGAEKGTATHMVLQYMDYGKTDSLDSIKSEIERLKTQKFLSERQAEAVEAGKILKLFNSEIGRRIMNAEKLTREFKFSLLCPAEDFFGNGEGESVLLQGVMDCLIEEKGELTVVDYKTDRVKGDALIDRAETYKGQLRAYAIAASRITGKPVKECVLYFLDAGESVTVKM